MKPRTLILSLLSVLVVSVVAGSFYMLSFSLAADVDRGDVDRSLAVLYDRAPYMRPWTDSVRRSGLLRDTTIVMPSGERHHALYMRCDSARGKTAVVVHGYKDDCYKFLFLGRMYHQRFGYNILLPDLHAHGMSEGDDIQMGWKDRLDVMRWTALADSLFADGRHPSRIVVHGVSMGAATTMCLSGESGLPSSVCAFVEDCGYTSVWDEFSLQLRRQFSLPAFPLMHTTSLLCKLCHGWSFGEASPLSQVSRCRLPMLFIHGDADTFVPYSMLRPLYDAKPGPKAVYVAKGSEHARAYLDNPEAYTSAVRRFLRSCFDE